MKAATVSAEGLLESALRPPNNDENPYHEKAKIRSLFIAGFLIQWWKVMHQRLQKRFAMTDTISN
jgi:hypothetical protein